MIEKNKSILPNNQYNTAYRNAPAQLSNILGSRYSELTSAEQQCLRQAYAHIKSLNTYDNIGRRYQNATNAEIRNWSEATKIFYDSGVASTDESSLWEKVCDEIESPKNYDFTTTDLNEDVQEDYDYLMRNTPVPNNGGMLGGAAPIFYDTEECQPIANDPLMIDLNGDGIKTTNTEKGIYFDHQIDGFAERSAWVSN